MFFKFFLTTSRRMTTYFPMPLGRRTTILAVGFGENSVPHCRMTSILVHRVLPHGRKTTILAERKISGATVNEYTRRERADCMPNDEYTRRGRLVPRTDDEYRRTGTIHYTCNYPVFSGWNCFVSVMRFKGFLFQHPADKRNAGGNLCAKFPSFLSDHFGGF